MQNKIDKAVSGKNNKRMKSNQPIASEGTAAWADAQNLMRDSQVNIPSEENIIHAKEWVDNGSRL